MNSATTKARRRSEAGGSVDADEKDAYIQGIFEPMRKMVDELSELTPPADDRQAIEQMLEQYEQGLEEAEDTPAKYFSGDALQEPNDSAEAYGLKRCQHL